MFWSFFLLPLLAVAADIVPIVTKGNAFYKDGTDERFYIKGVAYQPGGASNLYDPLSDPDVCKRDIKYFKELGVNTIRVYSIDNTGDHDECMEALADAGIYLILDTNIPHASIARDDGANCSYNTMYLNEVFATVKLMSKYDNTLGFFAANEVINDKESTPAARQVKAVVRDIKTFQRANGLRTIPVGYSAADVSENRFQSVEYFNCGDDEMARVDMFGYNDYSWCGSSSFTRSGYDKKVKEYSNYSVPLFLSEFGCNEVTPRKFTEVGAIFSDDMSPVFSGGIAYEYTEEANEYGLVEIGGSDNQTVTKKDDFDYLKEEFSSATFPKGDGGAQTDLEHASCPTLDSKWEASNDIPDTPKGALKYFHGAQPSGNGFDASTQWACVDGDNDVDDSSDYSGASGSYTPSARSSSSGSSNSNSNSNSGSSSSSRENDGNNIGTISGFASLSAFIFALIV
ncbi:hypothetical protein FT663_00422 [Candidozyma haemuli var. vulneris]|uniref:1,3-beta-glucanosyltransferase n=1 Tax=Candidozyma haemuli TaxID=45357 RepID=A0A2V1AV10_9ASCO|nr:hypothetical protein CXQ85_000611 [[Candida] haemuloni]KAF3985267.1 hypothetical protein FT662_05252 [[Candida] haemuloni var. vulneris]KAF3995531.1 hypothetical protein FT663_00422 [[Candida] haemuloni var. vulneris]PVH21629.1 hypothetical protein CXQ85_000611 [[Candida] haemuloni]